MPKLEEQESLKLYYFRNYKTGEKLRKFSGDEVSDKEVVNFEIPTFLLEQNNDKERAGTGKDPQSKTQRKAEEGILSERVILALGRLDIQR